jgi:NAD(P)-dependent dehydrogenase (short-subunit alcohol dehydrogenase family)
MCGNSTVTESTRSLRIHDNYFSGKVVLVTRGAMGGMGLSAVEGFAREGAAVVLSDVNTELGAGQSTRSRLTGTT